MGCDIASKDINVVVYILVAVFAISSWVDINGLWVELPILVQKLPEQWNLPSYMAIIIQIANIGPLAFTISNYFWPSKVKETPVIYVIITVGAIACLLLAFFWNTVTMIAGNLHSTALLTLQFFLAIVDCTSSVAFYPFMALFKPQYMTALFIGESLSGLLPSMLALGQGAGQMKCVNSTSTKNITINGTVVNMTTEYNVFPVYEQPKFSIEIFFFVLFGMMILSGVAFTLLNYLPYCQKEHLSETDSIGTSSDIAETEDTYELSDNHDRFFINAASENDSQSALLSGRVKKQIAIQGEKTDHVNEKTYEQTISAFRFTVLAMMTAWINALMNGTMPSIQAYSCLPYGNDPYHFAVSLSNIACPLSCFLAFFVQVTSLSKLLILTLVGSGFASYIMAMAVMSPSPLLIDKPAGAPLIVTAWVLMSFILTYTKVSVASGFRIGGRKALLWCGVFTQIGSAVGALVIFILINVQHYFQQAEMCKS
ncbi:solute carrier family 52, riboflavin transporter, member 3-B [Patella vulgata]|uniref:solute carrier family 52, riboflavin transporter, member 3-B n=1 Tax=Patella vulgata TaxID=6465 RepID=UPI0024A9543E|nr:solute carrier family 52, riboflavin transporter, member 3-B [Patella vulgata]